MTTMIPPLALIFFLLPLSFFCIHSIFKSRLKREGGMKCTFMHGLFQWGNNATRKEKGENGVGKKKKKKPLSTRCFEISAQKLLAPFYSSRRNLASLRISRVCELCLGKRERREREREKERERDASITNFLAWLQIERHSSPQPHDAISIIIRGRIK